MPTTAHQRPSEKFRKAMKQILSVPKEELNRREAKYRKERKAAKNGSQDLSKGYK